jgi:hypothetical protein
MTFDLFNEPKHSQAEENAYARTKEFLKSKRNMALTVLSICREAAAFLCDRIKGADEKVSYSYPRTIYKCPFELGFNDFDERSTAPMFPSPDFREYHEQIMAGRNAEKFERHIALTVLSAKDCYWIGFRKFLEASVKSELDDANKEIVAPSPMKPGSELNYNFLDEFTIPLIFELHFDSIDIPVGGLFFRVFPSVHEKETDSDYFPIVVGIAYFDPELKRKLYWWDRLSRGSQVAWSRLLFSVDQHIKELIDPNFAFKEPPTPSEDFHSGETKPGQLKKMGEGILRLQETTVTIEKKMDDLLQSTANLAEHRPQAKKPKRKPNTREQKVLKCMNRKGLDYCQCLDIYRTPPLDSWREYFWPGSYTKAYNSADQVMRQKWRQLIWDDRSKIKKRFCKTSNPLTRLGE